jgi:hypothetical protein
MTEYLVFDTAIWTVGLIPIFYGVGTISISYLLTNDDGAYPYMIIPPLISIGLGTFALMNPRNIFGRFVLFILSKFDLG